MANQQTANQDMANVRQHTMDFITSFGQLKNLKMYFS